MLSPPVWSIHLCSNIALSTSTIQVCLPWWSSFSQHALAMVIQLSEYSIFYDEDTPIWLGLPWQSRTPVSCQIQFTPGWKSAEWTWRWADLWNDLGFSLWAAPSVCHMVTTSDDREKSEMGVSAEWCVAIEHWRLSSIRIIFVDYQTSKLQYNY